MAKNIKQQNIQNQVDPTKYQVFICTSPTSIPLIGFLHAYIVINERGKLTRWDMWHTKNRVSSSEGYVHKDTYDPWTGLSIFYGNELSKERLRWSIKVVDLISGDENSMAYQMCKFINKNAFKYPLKNCYNFLGPNSNTFVQWFLDNFVQWSIKLPRRAVGARYKYK